MESNQQPQEFQGRLAAGHDWREIVAWVGDLPPMPAVAAEALKLVEDPNATATTLGTLLSKDPALAARVLKIANSALFSRQREITTLNQAVLVMGFKALKGVIVAATLRQFNKRFGDTERMVWEHSMGTALAATQIAIALRKKYVEEIFLYGLLHALGQVVFLFHDATSAAFKDVLRKILEEHLDYVTAEQSIYGYAHPLIGALVAKKWNFSPETCQVILHYSDAVEGNTPDGDQDEKAAVVQLADAICHAAGIGSPEGYFDCLPKINILMKYVGFPKHDDVARDELVNTVKEAFEREGSIFRQ
jgi:HD-like signal output (HDOD) protein